MRHSFPLALAAAFVVSTMTLAAQAPTSTSKAPAPAAQSKVAATMNPDSHFAMEAAGGGMAEVEIGQLAADKGTNPKVKEFGQKMVTDHGKANDELKSIASSKNITLPTSLDAKHQATKDRLSKLSGAAFDRAYVAEMLKDHQADSTAFHKEAASGKDPEIKAFATKTATVVDDHLKMVRDIQKELGSSKATQ